MPIGSYHEETGLLLEERGQLVFRRDAGGTWRLEAPAKAWRLLGARVRVKGRRAEFDVLAISELQPV